VNNYYEKALFSTENFWAIISSSLQDFSLARSARMVGEQYVWPEVLRETVELAGVNLLMQETRDARRCDGNENREHCREDG